MSPHSADWMGALKAKDTGHALNARMLGTPLSSPIVRIAYHRLKACLTSVGQWRLPAIRSEASPHLCTPRRLQAANLLPLCVLQPARIGTISSVRAFDPDPPAFDPDFPAILIPRL